MISCHARRQPVVGLLVALALGGCGSDDRERETPTDQVREAASAYGRAIALGTILLGLILLLAAGLTAAQQHERRPLLGRPS